MTSNRLVLTLAAVVGIACSTSAGSYNFSQIGFSINDGTQQIASACEHLPVLWGTTRETRYEIADQFTVILQANNREATIIFERIENPDQAARRFTVQQLEGAIAEEVTVQAQSGNSYDVVLSSTCSPN
ncbi:MAG TPA: hypothetical protein VHO25_19685 [Polyangiaceae bacterium]|nr:hypothetical protein [Polyangiaceae bacterium]